MSGAQTRDQPTAGDGLERDPQLAIDPRIAARWLSVRHDERRSRWRKLMLALGVVTAAVAAWGLAQSPLLAVRHVVLRGTEHTGTVRALAAARVEGRPMLTVDLNAAAHRIEALPWVAGAQLRRRWPATIEIDVSERTPAGQLAEGPGQAAIVDLQGRVLATGVEAAAVAASARPALPVLQGFPPRDTAGGTLGPSGWGALRFLQTWQRSSGAPGSEAAAFAVTAVSRGGDGSTTVVLAPGSLTVLLGSLDASDATGVNDKVWALRALLAQLPPGAGSADAVIDVRVPDAPVLTQGKKGSSVSTTQRG